MKVGIDITAIAYGRGVSNYTSNLVRALDDYTPLELELLGYGWGEYTTLQNWYQRSNLSSKVAANIIKRPVKLQELLWRVGAAKVATPASKLEIFHSWDWLQPPDTSIPLVSTIHDVAIKMYPETAHPTILAHHQRSWKILKDRRAHIIAVSRSTKQAICSLLEFDPKLVHVVYEALPLETELVAENLTEEAYDQLKTRLHLNKPFILFVGTREPRKNLHRLIQAWQPLAKEYDLLVAGAAGWDTSSSQTWPNKPRFLGQVSNQSLAVLYAEAELLAYPSLNEGFGLPILEAFYFGTPVVTSNDSAMKEVAGNAAELVNPVEVESITAGLVTVLNESSTQQKQRLQKMIIRKQLFSWQQVATQTKQVYQAAIESF